MASGIAAGPVKRYPLDDRSVYAVRVGTEAPTTVIFPGPVTALDGAGVSQRAEEAPPILISHQPGTRFFSVRAVQADAVGAANVIFRDRVFAFSFTTEAEPDRTVTFYEHPAKTARRDAARPMPHQLLALIDQAKEFVALSEQYPALVQRIERTTPQTTTLAGDITTTVEEVLRFDDEDALVLRVRFENRGKQVFRYAPAHLAVWIGQACYPVALTDAHGEVPAKHAEIVTVVILGNPDGSRGDISIKNTFSIVAPPLP
ncbi:hypothetical protein OH491_26755 [Termitidicoccus mucosus]|uniref:Uncharacterized protein n=2 Tax=Termitidicoccus mucosus TaxID=1184151 RepID=A0A178IBD0_9BACT|nr:hypothetical protein AW736_24015 [Opitutaceae bacterium TSB47]